MTLYAITDDDLVTGLASGVGAGPRVPPAFAEQPLDRLRLIDGEVVDCAERTDWHIDDRGRKRVAPADGRQPLTCAWDAALVRDGDAWRVRTEADDLAAAKARALASIAEAAGAARLQYVTAGAYQDEEYRQAATEAERLLAGEIAESAALQADIDAGTVDPRTGIAVATLAEAADLVLWRRDQWTEALNAVRSVRLQAQAAVARAADAAAVQAVLDGLVWPMP